MRWLWLTGATTISLIGTSLSGQAADTTPVAYPPAATPIYTYSPPIPIYNWTGFYVGANLGGAWASGTLSDSFTGGSVTASSSGVIGGGQLGYNFQNGNFVFGAEWVFDGTSLDASGSAGPLSATAKTNWVSTLAARFGWAASNNWLWYGKAGGGWAHNEATVTNFFNGTQVTGSNTNSGWLLGVGIQYAFAPNWSAKLEYDYLALDTWTLNSTVFAPNADQLSITRKIDTLTAGINYKF
jgi:opacity protein-like surface antigen